MALEQHDVDVQLTLSPILRASTSKSVEDSAGIMGTYVTEITFNIHRLIQKLSIDPKCQDVFITQPPVREVALRYELDKDYVEYVFVGIVRVENMIPKGTTVMEIIRLGGGIKIAHVVERVTNRLSRKQGNREGIDCVANGEVTIMLKQRARAEEAATTVAAV